MSFSIAWTVGALVACSMFALILHQSDYRLQARPKRDIEAQWRRFLSAARSMFILKVGPVSV